LASLTTNVIQIDEVTKQLDKTDAIYEKEESEKNHTLQRLHETEELLKKRKEDVNVLFEEVKRTEIQPIRLTKQTDAISRAVTNLEGDLNTLKLAIEKRNNDIEKKKRRKEEAGKFKLHLEEQLELHQQTLEKRELELAVVRKKLDHEKSISHDLVTRKVELNIKKRECESSLRFRSDQKSFAEKEYEGMKRMIKKKISYNDSTKLVIPEMELQLLDLETTLQSYRRENEEMRKKSAEYSEEVEVHMGRLLRQEGVEKGKVEVRRGGGRVGCLCPVAVYAMATHCFSSR